MTFGAPVTISPLICSQLYCRAQQPMSAIITCLQSNINSFADKSISYDEEFLTRLALVLTDAMLSGHFLTHPDAVSLFNDIKDPLPSPHIYWKYHKEYFEAISKLSVGLCQSSLSCGWLYLAIVGQVYQMSGITRWLLILSLLIGHLFPICLGVKVFHQSNMRTPTADALSDEIKTVTGRPCDFDSMWLFLWRRIPISCLLPLESWELHCTFSQPGPLRDIVLAHSEPSVLCGVSSIIGLCRSDHFSQHFHPLSARSHFPRLQV